MSRNVKELSPEELCAWLAERGEAGYRARQIARWLYARGAESFAAMSDLPRPLREKLAASFSIPRPQVVRLARAEDRTRKLLLALEDGGRIESVLIPAELGERLTLCISSQVGCGMGCAFCATATLGLARNLRADEIVDQVLEARRELLADAAAGEPQSEITNLVFMGMGEPLHNYDAVVRAIGVLTAEWGLGISPRRITVSTAGLVPQMKRLLEDTRVHLAVSLSATTDAQRRRLMPVDRKYPLETLLAACRELPLPRRRRITFEYVMLAGENDSLEDARRLGKLLRGIPSKVNLIPFNPYPGSRFAPTPRAAIEAFRAALLRQGVHATIRESRGREIQAACGQLAAQVA
ncbi:MAG: 23S rRNA (adenine(2503)-C(2))-methyltransferase RlmN [Deltaproteobacteria bacterium]|nr:23S rRNA (adenine(2503)-C(2))-methyltransferase RlmN [Deltaproteobacteria bacterium]